MRTSPLSRMLPVAVTIGLVISLPNLLSAGHVESRILLETSPLAWWEKNKSRVMESLSPKEAGGDVVKTDEKKMLEELGKQIMDNFSKASNMKAGYPTLLFNCLSSGGEKLPSDLKNAMKTIEGNYKNMIQKDNWQALNSANTETFLRDVHAGFLKGTSSKAQKAFKSYVYSVETMKRLVESQRKQLAEGIPFGVTYESPEFAIIDVLMLLEFLNPANEDFFSYYYTYNGITKETKNRYNIDFRPEAIAKMRKELTQILTEMGPAAAPYIKRALEDLKSNSADDEKTVVLPQGGVAVSYRWSTKATQFPTRVTPSFKREMEDILTKFEKPADVETGARSTDEQTKSP